MRRGRLRDVGRRLPSRSPIYGPSGRCMTRPLTSWSASSLPRTSPKRSWGCFRTNWLANGTSRAPGIPAASRLPWSNATRASSRACMTNVGTDTWASNAEGAVARRADGGGGWLGGHDRIDFGLLLAGGDTDAGGLLSYRRVGPAASFQAAESTCGRQGEEVRFATDSPLEEPGFEPLVPRETSNAFRAAPFRSLWRFALVNLR